MHNLAMTILKNYTKSQNISLNNRNHDFKYAFECLDCYVKYGHIADKTITCNIFLFQFSL